jgi:hypothetical protein
MLFICFRILNELLDEDMLFTSDKWYRMINLITSSETAQNMTFSYLLEHFKELKQKYVSTNIIYLYTYIFKVNCIYNYSQIVFKQTITVQEMRPSQESILKHQK